MFFTIPALTKDLIGEGWMDGTRYINNFLRLENLHPVRRYVVEYPCDELSKIDPY
jgi:hypothetical protein